jgi:hypothetical protein
MRNRHSLIIRIGAMAALLLAFNAPAAAQYVPSVQTLDRVFAYDTKAVLNMATGNADTSVDFTNLGVTPTTAIVTCTVAVVGGLYCLDGNTVRNWANPLQPSVYTDTLKCADLGLDLKKGDGCTAMTVDDNAAIWLAVKKRNTHSIFKVAKGACPVGTANCKTIGARYAVELYFGRPPIVDLVAIDAGTAKTFRPCPNCAIGPGVLGIEERKNAVFFRDPLPPQAAEAVPVVASRDWGLQGNELLQDITYLQLPDSVETTILATTDSGRILARNTSYSDLARQVFPAPGVPTGPSSCSAGPQQYGMRASTTTGIVYVSNRCNHQVLALVPNSDFSMLVSAPGTVPLSTQETIPPPPNSPPNTPPTVITYAVVGLTIAPGNSLDLATCSVSCTFINAPGGVPAAQFNNLQLFTGSPSGSTVFQMKEIPDCRYVALFPTTSDGIAKRAVCGAAGAVIGPTGVVIPVPVSGLFPPELQDPTLRATLRLNVTPLLPEVVTKAYGASGLGSGVLPPLLVSQQYRAQSRTDYLFEAFFVVPQPGIRYVNTFEGVFKVPELEGTDISDDYCRNEIYDPNQWNVATYVSELYKTKAVGAYNYVDTLANVGCGSIRGGLQGMSMVTYDLQINPDTYAKSLSSPNSPAVTENNDAVYARLLQTLYDDLWDVQMNFACEKVDLPLQQSAPISKSNCNGLTSTWNNGKGKLDKCIAAAFQPKSSASNENCQSWVSQLTNYRNALPATTPSQDVGNRVGELKKRIQVLLHVYYNRFQPSIPPLGYCREGGSC